MKAFEDALLAAFVKNALNDEFWLTALGDVAKRTKLRDCYDVIWSDPKLVSMALYAGPVRSDACGTHLVASTRRSHPAQFWVGCVWLGPAGLPSRPQIARQTVARTQA